jgi:hypothetical protein
MAQSGRTGFPNRAQPATPIPASRFVHGSQAAYLMPIDLLDPGDPGAGLFAAIGDPAIVPVDGSINHVHPGSRTGYGHALQSWPFGCGFYAGWRRGEPTVDD